MMAGRTLAALRDFVRHELLSGQGEDLTDTTPLLEWGILDSLSMQTLLVFIEQKLGVHVPDDKVKPEHFATLRGIAALVESLSAAPEGTPWERYEHAVVVNGIDAQDVTVRGGSLRVLRTVGARPTWVLLPELGTPAASFGPILKSVKSVQSALAIELAGFGASRLANERSGFRAQVDATVELLRHLDLAPYVLVGQGAAAVLAREVARRYPPEALALVAIDGSRDGQAFCARYRRYAADPAAWLATGVSAPGDRGDLLALSRIGVSAPAYAAFFDDDAARAFDEIFAPARVPTLFVAGDEDKSRARDAYEAAARTSGARIAWLARCGQFPTWERPQELWFAIDRFVRALVEAAV